MGGLGRYAEHGHLSAVMNGGFVGATEGAAKLAGVLVLSRMNGGFVEARERCATATRAVALSPCERRLR